VKGDLGQALLDEPAGRARPGRVRTEDLEMLGTQGAELALEAIGGRPEIGQDRGRLLGGDPVHALGPRLAGLRGAGLAAERLMNGEQVSVDLAHQVRDELPHRPLAVGRPVPVGRCQRLELGAQSVALSPHQPQRLVRPRVTGHRRPPPSRHGRVVRPPESGKSGRRPPRPAPGLPDRQPGRV
jgi:hypothetical protein